MRAVGTVGGGVVVDVVVSVRPARPAGRAVMASGTSSGHAERPASVPLLRPLATHPTHRLHAHTRQHMQVVRKKIPHLRH